MEPSSGLILPLMEANMWLGTLTIGTCIAWRSGRGALGDSGIEAISDSTQSSGQTSYPISNHHCYIIVPTIVYGKPHPNTSYTSYTSHWICKLQRLP